MKILVVGDSTGVSASHSATAYLGVSPWTECVVAGQLLNEKFGQGAFTFVNKSKGGSGFADWLYGSAEYGTPSFPDLIAQNPSVDLFYVQLGINNAIRGGTASGVAFAVAEMHRLVTASGKKIMFGTPNPVVYPGRPEVNDLLWTFKNTIESKCAELGIPLVNHWNAAVATGVWTKLLADGIHPKEEYYRFKGQTLFMALAYI